VALQRAYGREEKDARRQTILAAAESLFIVARSLPTAADIAAAAGLAKGTLYLYFRSREDIFAEILREDWAVVLNALDQGVQPDRSPPGVVTAFIDGLVTAIAGRPNLMPLDAMLAELKKGMSDGARQQFHDVTSQGIAKLGHSLDGALGLPSSRGVQLLVRSHAFARGLWQSLDSIDPDCAVAEMLMPTFSGELREALREYWRGALTA
jgi:AcrR family transcriptional regulator